MNLNSKGMHELKLLQKCGYGSVALLAECLAGMHEALGLIPRTT